MAVFRSRLTSLCPVILDNLNFYGKHGHQTLFQTSVRTAIFNRKPKELVKTNEPEVRMDGPSALSQTSSLKKRTSVRTVKGYKPPNDVEERIKNIASEFFAESTNWKKISLDDRVLKFKFLTKCIDEFDHNIPNSDLNDMTHISDIVQFFQTEIHDTSSYEDLPKLDLPRNLHIQLEAIRFNPETDTFFDGVTAFPKRPTIVSSIKYRHKYKGHDGEHREK